MIEVKIFGVRGSAPISGRNYLSYGGNTACLTLRTPDNTLIFLDAGTGIRLAEEELEVVAERVILAISHTHADHIQGLGMTRLPYLSDVEGYELKKLGIIGPDRIKHGLSKFYDGDLIWPVGFSADSTDHPRMYAIDYDRIIEYQEDLQEIRIDEFTTVKLLQGNHPVANGVVLYRFEIDRQDQKVIVVYATDNEFDFIGNRANPEFDRYVQSYSAFISNADLLIADAQYTKEDYLTKFQGYGHSYHEQVIKFALESGVKHLLLTHHHLYKDDFLDRLQRHLDELASQHNIQIELAKEGREIRL